MKRLYFNLEEKWSLKFSVKFPHLVTFQRAMPSAGVCSLCSLKSKFSMLPSVEVLEDVLFPSMDKLEMLNSFSSKTCHQPTLQKVVDIKAVPDSMSNVATVLHYRSNSPDPNPIGSLGSIVKV